MDCGAACLKMVAYYYGKNYSLEYLRKACFYGKEGVSLLNLSGAAEKLGFRTFRAKINLESLINNSPLPAILHWNQNHFIVLLEVKKSLFSDKVYFKIADPENGILIVNEKTFISSWISTFDNYGIGLFLEPSSIFYDKENIVEHQNSRYILRYLKPHKKLIFQVIAGMISASAVTLILPFLSQLMIDKGVQLKNLDLIYLLLGAQLALYIGSYLIDAFQNWLLLHINTRLSLNIISDFLIKLLNLPIKIFDGKAVGDITQRINDHHRIENFLTKSLLNTLFSLINIMVYLVVLLVYSKLIFYTFILFSTLSITWILLFQKKRESLDYKRFTKNKENQDKLYEMIVGMQDIKLYGSETTKRWQWEDIQIKLFKLNISGLSLEQYQRIGYIFLNHVKNILITFLAARAVMEGQLSLGVLLSISFIIGQTNGPIEQIVDFFKSGQDAKLSLARMNEIHNKKNEDELLENSDLIYDRDMLENDLILENASFQYEGPNSPKIINNVNLIIPKGKITAIVGASGSGKTTLLKLLLGFYEPTEGRVKNGNMDICQLPPKMWRSMCGTVMQDGYLFSDSIAHNIAMDGGEINDEMMQKAVSTANLKDFIESCPLGYTTKIGNNGIGISGGQKQRVFIARAVYKNPPYLFLDEATSSLDAVNESQIMDQLETFFSKKTVVVIAHRLSTVKNADQIIVMDNGCIVERGSHADLVKENGRYFRLIRNQLELG